MSNPVISHVLLIVQTGVEVLVSERSSSCLMLTTYCLKAIVTVFPRCTYPEFAALSINYNEFTWFPLSGCEMLLFVLYKTNGINCGEN
jgi:hypothetical protein